MRAVESVAVAANAQQGLKVEVLVINDSNESLALNPKLSNNLSLRVLDSPKRPFGGPSAARDYGIRQASHDIILFLDDDDEFLPNRFARCVSAFSELECKMVVEQALRVNQVTGESSVSGLGLEESAESIFVALFASDESKHVATGATAFLRDTYIELGGIDHSLRLGEDGEMLTRFAYFDLVVALGGDPVVKINRHDSNISRATEHEPFYNMKAIYHLYKNTRYSTNPKKDDFLLDYIRARFDFQMFRCRTEYSGWQKLTAIARVVRYMPIRFVNVQALRSLVVAIIRAED